MRSKWFKSSPRIGFTPDLDKELKSMPLGQVAELTHPEGDHYVILHFSDYDKLLDKIMRLSGASFLIKEDL
jgi:hypothetical protein